MRPSLSLLAGAITAALLGTTATAALAADPAAGTLPGSPAQAGGTLSGTVRLIAVDPSSAVLPAPRGSSSSDVRAGSAVSSGAVSAAGTVGGSGAVSAAGSTGTTGTTGSTGTGEGGMITQVLVDVGGRLLQIPADQGAGLRSGDRVVVSTVRTPAGDQVRSVSATSRVGASATATPVTGTHRLTLLPVYWDRPDSATQASLTALANATAAYWSEQSAGRIAIKPTVRDWAKIPNPGSCSPATITNAALVAHGITLPTSRFDHVLIYFPARSDCGWAGLGQVSGSVIWDNGLQLTDVTAHEFGHNLGLGHANTAVCTSGGQRVTLSSSCTISEYRDYADVMGIAMYQPSGNLNTSMADWLGLVTTVTAAAATHTTVDLAPLAQVTGTRAVRVRTSTGWLYADYRPATGRDVRMPAWAGVQLHLLPDGGYPQSQLLDAQPGSASAFSATSLPVGRPWSVPGTDLTLTVTSVTASAARIDIAPVTAGAAVPVPVLTGPAAGTVVSSTTGIGWRVTSAVSAIRLLVDGQQRSQSAVTGLSGTLRLSGLTTGQHQVTAQALDATGQVGTTSAAVAVVADVTPPTVPSGLALSSTELLSWRTATDSPAGVAGYVITLDGGAPVRVGAVTSTQVRTPVGRHVWWVAAVDRVGNTSAAAGLLVTKTSAVQRAGTRTQRVSPGMVRTAPAQVLRGTVQAG